MNVRQLIEALQKQDQELEVYFFPDACGCVGDCPVEMVSEDGLLFYSNQEYQTKKVVMLRTADEF